MTEQLEDLFLVLYEQKGSSGFTVVKGQVAAEGLEYSWRNTKGSTGFTTITPVRLCDEDDPDLLAYDFEREHYVAAIDPSGSQND